MLFARGKQLLLFEIEPRHAKAEESVFQSAKAGDRRRIGDRVLTLFERPDDFAGGDGGADRGGNGMNDVLHLPDVAQGMERKDVLFNESGDEGRSAGVDDERIVSPSDELREASYLKVAAKVVGGREAVSGNGATEFRKGKRQQLEGLDASGQAGGEVA